MSAARAWPLAALAVALAVTSNPARPRAQTGAAPVIVVQTSRGAFSFETFPDDAPVTVAHIVALANAGFYDGQRVHRAVPGFIVQFGDPQTKDLSKRAVWGRGDLASSGHPIGVAEIVPKRTHVKGAVGISHMGDPSKGDSQIYVTLAPRPDLDNHYAVFGQVTAGVDVPAELQVGDAIERVYVKN
jgi:peptidyl-prolyl cis-trans isomerase B (cyclophilin B)